MNKKSKAAARQAVVDASSIPPEKLTSACEIICKAGANGAQASAAAYDMAFLVIGYVSGPRQETPAKTNRRRLLKMSRSLVSFRDELQGMNPDIRIALNRQLKSDETYGEAWRSLTTSARSLARRITEFEDNLIARKRSNEDARQLFRSAALVWHRATGKWPSTAAKFTGNSQEAASPLHKLIRDLADAGSAPLPPKVRKELLTALSLNSFMEAVRMAKVRARKTGQKTA